jgi:PhnB protein
MSGAVRHAATYIGDAVLEFGESLPQPAAFYRYVPDADAVYRQAVAAGANALFPPGEQPHGDRVGGVRDAWGNTWYIASQLPTPNR